MRRVDQTDPCSAAAEKRQGGESAAARGHGHAERACGGGAAAGDRGKCSGDADPADDRGRPSPRRRRRFPRRVRDSLASRSRDWCTENYRGSRRARRGDRREPGRGGGKRERERKRQRRAVRSLSIASVHAYAFGSQRLKTIVGSGAVAVARGGRRNAGCGERGGVSRRHARGPLGAPAHLCAPRRAIGGQSRLGRSRATPANGRKPDGSAARGGARAGYHGSPSGLPALGRRGRKRAVESPARAREAPRPGGAPRGRDPLRAGVVGRGASRGTRRTESVPGVLFAAHHLRTERQRSWPLARPAAPSWASAPA